MYEQYFEQFHIETRLRNLTASTCQTYQQHLRIFFDACGKEPAALTPDDVRAFLLAKKDAGMAASTVNLYRAAIYFFVRRVLHQRWDWELIPTMKTNHKLPTLLTQEEVARILDATINLKHKAMLTTLYSGGLRVSELCHLQYQDISRRRMQIYVRPTKNRRDHYTILSKRNLQILTAYWFRYGRPTGLLFPSDLSGTYLSRNTLLALVKKSAKRAGIQKTVNCHCLRHAFACHLLEAGVPLIYIQSLLGHLHLKSTEAYLHMTNKAFMGIQSPLDLYPNIPSPLDGFGGKPR